jgi:hypothetical protein
MNKILNSIYIQEFFDALNFGIEIIHQNNNTKNDDHIYTINNETVLIEVKNEVRPQSATSFICQKNKKLPLLIASKYITPKAKYILKENNINYIDSFGNAFIHLKNLKIFIEQGNAKPAVSNYSNILTQASAQVIFQLLKDPSQINKTQRYLAQISKVSLGSVSKCIKALLDEGFVVKWNKDKKYQLVRRKELLEKWVALCNEKILPAYKIGRFTFSKQHNNWETQLNNNEALWSGEPAASLITKYLNPEQFSLFTVKTKQEIITQLKLVPDINGEITIYAPFWIISKPFERVNIQNVVDPLIIYAELIYSNNNRNIETAQILFNEYIKPNL